MSELSELESVIRAEYEKLNRIPKWEAAAVEAQRAVIAGMESKAERLYRQQFNGRVSASVKLAENKVRHEVFESAPCEWSKERGATHTLNCGYGPGRGTRPAILKKTVMHVGVDEDSEGNIVWEKWAILPGQTYVLPAR